MQRFIPRILRFWGSESYSAGHRIIDVYFLQSRVFGGMMGYNVAKLRGEMEDVGLMVIGGALLGPLLVPIWVYCKARNAQLFDLPPDIASIGKWKQERAKMQDQFDNPLRTIPGG